MKLDAIYRNANVITLDEARPSATDIGVLNGRIVALDGELDQISASATIDLEGRTVIPGINDTHCHTIWYGLGLSEINLDDARTLDDVYRALSSGMDSLASADSWLVATGLNHFHFRGVYPDIAQLDRLSHGRPLVIKLTSGHAVFANTEALRRAGVLAEGFAGVPGGVVTRDADFRPTGLLEERAQALVLDLIKPYPIETMVTALDAATAVYASQGVTSFTEAGVGTGMIGHSPLEIDAYQIAFERGLLRSRAQLMPTIANLQALAGYNANAAGVGLPLGLRTGFGNEHLSLGPVKMFFDGAISAKTAALHNHYEGEAHGGYLSDDPATHIATAEAVARAGWSLAIHAIGDEAVDLAIAAIEAAVRVAPQPRIPHRIEHAGLVNAQQLVRLAELDIAVTPQAAFFGNTGDTMLDNLGPVRSQHLFRGKSFLDAGVTVGGSSDRPCADGNPFHGIARFMDRLTASGRIVGNESERLTFLEALGVYTTGAAATTGTSLTKGAIKAGMLADFATLDRSPLGLSADEVESLQVVRTVVGGKTVFGTE